MYILASHTKTNLYAYLSRP